MFSLGGEHDLIAGYLVENTGQIFCWKILVIIDASIVLDEIFYSHTTTSQLRAVLVCVQHDARVRQNIRSVCIGECIWISRQVSLGKLQHESIDLLCFTGQSEA